MLPPFLATPLRRSAVLPFGAVGLLYGSWAGRIPEIQAQTGLSEGALGTALLGMAVGLVVAASAAGSLTTRHGAHRVALAGLALFGLIQVGPGLATGFASLGLAFIAIGLTSGLTDVAMNAHATEVEAAEGRSILGACHGVFSLGGMVGAGLGALAAAGSVPLALHLAASGLLAAGAVVWHGGQVLRPRAAATAHQGGVEDGAEGVANAPRFALPRGPVAGLAALSFCGMIIEGAMGDWSALFLREVYGASASAAALGFGTYMGSMAAARFAADALTSRFGDQRLVRGGTLLGAAGLVLCLTAPALWVAVMGFAAVGLGLAGVVPSLFRAATRVPGLAGGVGIASVTSVGYMGFMVGPPLLGFVAEAAGFRTAFGVLVALALTMALASGWAFRRLARPAELFHAANPVEAGG